LRPPVGLEVFCEWLLGVFFVGAHKKDTAGWRSGPVAMILYGARTRIIDGCDTA
jgi:hypothetical protein